MALMTDLIGVGMAPEQAQRLGWVSRTIAGTGTSQSGATAITTNLTLGTTSGGATAFVLPSAAELDSPYIFINTSATTALVFPPSGGAINGGSTNASISVAQNQSVYLLRTSTNAWYGVFANSTGSATIDTLTTGAINASDASLGVTGLAAAQGGAIALVGGASSTSGNAGGAVTAVGGAGGATGVGGAVTLTGAAGGATSGAGGAVTATGGAGSAGNSAGGAVTNTGGAGQGSAAGGAVISTGGAGGATGAGGAASLVGGAGGATSGTGGAVSITGGAGSAGNSVGGAASVVGGAGQGTAAGGAVAVTGGASGAGATGNGGDVTITGGAAASTDGSGGSVILAGGALAGTGFKGSTYQRGLMNLQFQAAPTAKTVTAAITAAELVTGIITTTGATGPSVHQLPTGTLLKAQFPDIADGDSFDFSVINTGVGAADDATITVNTDVTIVGNPTVGALTDATIISGSGRFRARFVTGTTWIVYRLA